MKRFLTYLTGPTLAALVLLLLLAGTAWAQEPSSRVASANPPAPNFSGVTLDGDQVSLQSYHGKPLVLIFWASW